VWKLDNNLAGSVNPSPVLNIHHAESWEFPAVFPNPFRNAFSVIVPDNEEVVSVVLTDAQGRSQAVRFNQIQSGSWSVECANYAAGWYLLEVYTHGGKVFTQKIMKSGE
jgi:hypothetical protein